MPTYTNTEVERPFPEADNNPDYQELWYLLYGRLQGAYPHITDLMEEMDPSILEEE